MKQSLTHSQGRAPIFQHPSAPVTFDPPVTPESVERAKAAAEKERAELDRLIHLRDDDMLELSHMVDRHGWRQVFHWVLGLQAIHQDVRRG